MKKIILCFLLLLTTFGTACTKVAPGYVAVKVNNYGTQRGVKDYPIKVGRVWYNPLTQDVYKFPTFLQNYEWKRGQGTDESFTVNSVEGAAVNFDVALSVGFVGDSVPRLFVDYRKDANHIITSYVRNTIRNEFSEHASKMRVVDIFGVNKQMLIDSTLAVSRNIFERRGILVDQLSIVGEIRVSPEVQKSITAVLTAAQRAIEAETKVRSAKAEADQLIESAKGDSAAAVIRAQGIAEANKLLRQQLTRELIDYETIKKWDGTLPQFTGNSIPLINLSTPAKK